MTMPLYMVCGCKGGVGKSLVAMALIDYLQGRGDEVLLVESDTGNPDVAKAYQASTPTELLDLDTADGWIGLVEVCAQHGDSVVVVNTASRNSAGIEKFGGTLNNSLGELRRKLTAFWVINRQRDSLEQLKSHLEQKPPGVVHVVRNGYFGDEAKFQLYNESRIRATVESQGGRSVTFPDLADRVADALYNQRLSIGAAARELPLGNRAELLRWRGEVRRMLEGVTHE